ncbi:discoidin domain-containing protein [Actinomadura madurae]|nr:discoidin domain-containing protein [Actinomadura madurae]MCP9971365.1 discoidin domain-containing protein [Actinomadura madurae]
MRQKSLRILLAAALAAAGLTGPAAVPAAADTNLAAGKTVSASSSNGRYTASNVNDGDQATYWESANNAFPQWIQVDLGASVQTDKVVLKLPTANWGTRTQALSVQGSTDGTTYGDLAGPGGRVFDPAAQNTVTLTYPARLTRYLRVHVTANTGWPAAQLSELEVYGPSTGDRTAPTAPSGLAFSEPSAGKIRLTWNASSDAVGVAGYDVYANGEKRASVAGDVLTYTDDQPGTATVSYFVRARDAAGNVSAGQRRRDQAGHGRRDEPRRREADHGVLARLRVHRGERQRQRPRDVLGVGAGRLSGHADRRSRREGRPHLRGREAEPGRRVGDPHPDDRGARPEHPERLLHDHQAGPPRTPSTRRAGTPCRSRSSRPRPACGWRSRPTPARPAARPPRSR